MICPSVANDESLNAKAVPGQRYDGKSGTGDRIFLRATGGGARLSTYRFVVRTRCGDGRPGWGALDQDGEGPARIAADGTFSYGTSRPSAYTLRGGKRVPGQSTFRLSGRFAPRGYSVTGTLESRFRSRGLSCDSGSVPFTAYLDGSPEAPFRSRNVTTGEYSDLPEHLKRFRFHVFLPARAGLGLIPVDQALPLPHLPSPRELPRDPARGPQVRVPERTRDGFGSASRRRATTWSMGSSGQRSAGDAPPVPTPSSGCSAPAKAG